MLELIPEIILAILILGPLLAIVVSMVKDA